MSAPATAWIESGPLATSEVGVPAANAAGQLRQGRPTWEIARYFPEQGNWTEEDYLGLENQLGHHIKVELANGWLEILPVATEIHQDLIKYLMAMLDAYAMPHKLGKTSFSGIRVRTIRNDPKHYREPDVAFMLTVNSHRRGKLYWDGADLVMEVVSGSPDDRKRDYETKVVEYAAAGIPEYWIVDPEKHLIRVFVLNGSEYRLHGDFTAGMIATSVLLPGFAVSVDEAFAAGRE